jgi:glucose/arabinose dehydrogenase
VDLPTAIAWTRGTPGFFVATQPGVIYHVRNGVAKQVLDLRKDVTPYVTGSERGMLGMAFDPRDGRLFVDFTDANNDSHVESYAMVKGAPVASSRREIVFLRSPGYGHKGGQLTFDASGHLFVSFGDGNNNRVSRDKSTFLGSIIRIVPRLDAAGYDVPKDNPFVGVAGARPEIWLHGFRNPWRFSIDAATRDMWIGDVGEDEIEEVDLAPRGRAGLDFGWPYFEGTNEVRRGAPPGLVPPVYEYPHTVGIAVQGGFVYRGTKIHGLAGAYVFGDVNGSVWARGTDGVVTLPIRVRGTLVGFGQGPDGELYTLSLDDGVSELVPA